MYCMPNAACRTPNARKLPKCSDISTALKPTTGMLAASMVPRMMKGAYATYSLLFSLPRKMQPRQCMGNRLMMKE